MRLIVMYDLPVETPKERKSYQEFHKLLVVSGFMKMQASVYVKRVKGAAEANTLIDKMRKYRPERGLVQALKISDQQYEDMIYIVGKPKDDVIDIEHGVVWL